jgi:hypothetical protein
MEPNNDEENNENEVTPLLVGAHNVANGGYSTVSDRGNVYRRSTSVQVTEPANAIICS